MNSKYFLISSFIFMFLKEKVRNYILHKEFKIILIKSWTVKFKIKKKTKEIHKNNKLKLKLKIFKKIRNF